MDPNPNIPPKPPQLPPPDPPATPPSDPDPAPDPSAGANGDGDGDKLAAPAGIGAAAQMLLRDPVALLNWLKGGAPLAGKLAAVALAGFALFGVVVGLFSLGDQLWAAPVKVVAGTFFAALICLPSLYIFAALAGAEAKPGALLAALAAALALCALLLAGIAPVIWLFAMSSNSEVFMGILCLVAWFVSLGFGLGIIGKAGRVFGASRPGHLRFWMFLFALVTIQMATTLRPIVGKSDRFLTTEKKFFLVHWGEQIVGEVEEASESSRRQNDAANGNVEAQPSDRGRGDGWD